MNKLGSKSMMVALFCALLHSSGVLHADNQVLGEVQLQGASKVEKTSGVWIDGQYVGYLKELKGSKKVLLLPGEHEIAVRQSGYKEFVRKVIVEPGQKQVVSVAMNKDPQAQKTDATAKVKISISATLTELLQV